MKVRFPVGGERKPVHDFLRDRGFVMSKWSDKVWHRADGVTVSVYGAGSMAQVTGKNGELIADAPLDIAVE
jgi:hypothetical protein